MMPQYWREELMYDKGPLLLDGPSYMAWVSYLSKQLQWPKKASLGGGWKIAPFSLRKGKAWDMLKDGKTVGKNTFTTDVTLPVLYKDGVAWMSPTPYEIISQRPGIVRAWGRCAIGGLGMGWFASRVAQKSCVKNVTVFEIDPHIAAFFGSRVKPFGVTTIVKDAFTINPLKWDSLLYDVWQGRCEAQKDIRWKNFAEHANAWAWGAKNG